MAKGLREKRDPSLELRMEVSLGSVVLMARGSEKARAGVLVALSSCGDFVTISSVSRLTSGLLRLKEALNRTSGFARCCETTGMAMSTEFYLSSVRLKRFLRKFCGSSGRFQFSGRTDSCRYITGLGRVKVASGN